MQVGVLIDASLARVQARRTATKPAGHPLPPIRSWPAVDLLKSARFSRPVRSRGIVFTCGLAGAAVFCGPPASNVSAASQQPPQAIDWQTSPLDLDLRGMNGERYTFLCPPGKPLPARLAGSGPYTDNSSICTAAVHAGALHAKAGGEVTVEIRPGQAAFPGSVQNYIQSGSYDYAWGGSFVVIRADVGATQHDVGTRIAH